MTDDGIIANLAFIMRGSNTTTLHTSLYASEGYRDGMSPGDMIDRYLSLHAKKAATGAYQSLDDVERVLFQRKAPFGAKFCWFRSVDIAIFNVERVDTPTYKVTPA